MSELDPLLPNNSSSSVRQGAAADPSLKARLYDVFMRTWDLGFTAFGGPPVHVKILHRRFVDEVGGPPWVDEQTVYQSNNFYDPDMTSKLSSSKSFLLSPKPCQGLRRPSCSLASCKCTLDFSVLFLCCCYGCCPDFALCTVFRWPYSA